MKICFILISEGWGGAETVVHDTIFQLQRNDVEVSLIINEEISDFFGDLDVKKFNLGSLFHTSSLLKMILKPHNIQRVNKQAPIPLLNLFLIRLYFKRIKGELLSFIQENQIDIVHSHLEYADMLAFQLKDEKNQIKWVMSLHGHWFSLLRDDFSNPFLGNSFSINFLKKAFRNADRVLFVSDYLQRKFNEIIEEETKNQLVIPNGINIGKITPFIQKTPKNSKVFRIFFPGGPKPTKGGDILIESIHKIKDHINPFELIIALEVPGDHKIRQMISEYHLKSHVNFVGFLKKDEYLNILSSADVMAMPSRFESFGLAYLEAMALGIPVIASKNTGAAEIIENYHNGLLIEPKPLEVAEALLKLHNEDGLREKISNNNLKDVKKFDWDHIVKLYMEFYETL